MVYYESSSFIKVICIETSFRRLMPDAFSGDRTWMCLSTKAPEVCTALTSLMRLSTWCTAKSFTRELHEVLRDGCDIKIPSLFCEARIHQKSKLINDKLNYNQSFTDFNQQGQSYKIQSLAYDWSKFGISKPNV